MSENVHSILPGDTSADPKATSADDAPQLPPLRSVHTTSLPALLRQLHASIAVSTYQAGKLVFLRCGDGVLNTHFRAFSKPMGVAAAGGRFAIGTTAEIWEFHDVPAVCPKLDAKEPPAKHDACFLPRSIQFTGDIQIHEMAWAGAARDELWFVNTRFSCLCTRSDRHSFVPRWRPPFITHLAPKIAVISMASACATTSLDT